MLCSAETDHSQEKKKQIHNKKVQEPGQCVILSCQDKPVEGKHLTRFAERPKHHRAHSLRAYHNADSWPSGVKGWLIGQSI